MRLTKEQYAELEPLCMVIDTAQHRSHVARRYSDGMSAAASYKTYKTGIDTVLVNGAFAR